MKLYIDGDAFPNLLKPIVLRSIERLSLPTKVIANKKIHIGKSKHIEYIIVDQGDYEADHHIVDLVEVGDHLITKDKQHEERIVIKDNQANYNRGEL